MGTLYDTEFYERCDTNTRPSANLMVPLLHQLANEPKSVFDAGCGGGHWLNEFHRIGVSDIVGADGDWLQPDQMAIPVDCFERRDLSKPFELPRTFDLALSFEVAEHLPPASAAGFVESLTSLAPMVAFSAAIPGQGGRHHVNEQWPSYWVDLFSTKGYVVFDAIRPLIWGNDLVASFYRQNMAVFVLKDKVEDYPALQGMKAGKFDPLVHPVVYNYTRNHNLKRLMRKRFVESMGPLRPVARNLKRRIQSGV